MLCLFLPRYLSESVINIKHIFIVNTSNTEQNLPIHSPFPDLQLNIPTKLKAAVHPQLFVFCIVHIKTNYPQGGELLPGVPRQGHLLLLRTVQTGTLSLGRTLNWRSSGAGASALGLDIFEYCFNIMFGEWRISSDYTICCTQVHSPLDGINWQKLHWLLQISSSDQNITGYFIIVIIILF